MLGIIKGLQDKDPKVQDYFYKSFSNNILAVCKSRGLTTEDAEEVRNEVLLKAITDIHLYDESKGGFYSWLVRMAKNKSIDRQRYLVKGGAEGVEKIPVEFCYSAEDRVFVEDKILMEDVLTAINNVKTNRFRKVFKLHVVQGFSHKEIAEKIGASEITIRGNHHRAKKAIREELEKLGLKRA